MGFHAPKTQHKSDPAPSGTHVARCIQMLDLGTHEDTWQGEIKDKRSVRLGFELPNETKVFKEENGPQPYVVGRDFTFSMAKKANFRKFLEVWRGMPFTDDEANAFDVSVLLDKPAMISVSHVTKGENVYANLDSATRLPKGTTCPARINDLAILHLDDFGKPEFGNTLAKLPEWLRKKIESSQEYQDYEEDPRIVPKANVSPVDEEADDIPF